MLKLYLSILLKNLKSDFFNNKKNALKIFNNFKDIINITPFCVFALFENRINMAI